MPYVLFILGEMLLISGIKGTQGDFFALLKNDFTGTGSFIYWLAAIAVVGGIGYIPGLKPFSNAFLVLILIVLLLNADKSGTLFQNFQAALQTSAQASTTTPISTAATSSTTPSAPANSNQSTPANASANLSSAVGNLTNLASDLAQPSVINNLTSAFA